MYCVEAKSDIGIVSKEYAYKACAIKEAARVANAGFVTLDNPEMDPKYRRVEISSVIVYDTKNPDVDIDF